MTRSGWASVTTLAIMSSDPRMALTGRPCGPVIDAGTA